ncbi:MAG: insulinase family protein [Firmicutes bacterium]|nr:insulinase family protein [Bacillota bacterium]
MGLQTLSSEVLKETIYHGRLSVGLDVYVMPKLDYNEKYAVFATRYGSIDTSFVTPGQGTVTTTPAGVAHFLEHKLFEGPKGNVFEIFATLGASVNAYTSYALTSYLFSTTDNFNECLSTLLSFVQTPYFTQESVEKEQGIIAQEITMYEDNPAYQGFSNLLKALYHSNAVREKIAGTVTSVGLITPEILYQCHSTFYHPQNMVLFVVGAVEPMAIVEQAEEQLAQGNYEALGALRRVYPTEPASIRESQVRTEMAVARPLCYLGFKDIVLKAKDELLKRQLISSLTLQILFGKTSGLYNRLYEAGLIDDSFDTYYTAEETFAHAILGGSTDEPDQLVEAVLVGLEEARENGIAQEEFARQKRKSIGSFLYAFNSLEFIASNFISTHLKGSSLFSYLDILQQLTLDDVERCLEEQLSEKHLAISMVRPR